MRVSWCPPMWQLINQPRLQRAGEGEGQGEKSHAMDEPDSKKEASVLEGRVTRIQQQSGWES